jgi:dTDP-glucose 4,6-dehydratase
MKDVLITGVAEFLCERFIDDGYNVIGVDNLFSGSIKDISNFKNKKAFLFIETDIRKIHIIKLQKKNKLHY